MKIFLRVFTLVFFFISCMKDEISHITFSGNIRNNTENILKVTNYNSTLSEEIAIDSSGNFSGTAVIQEDGYYFFQIGRSYTTVRFKKGRDVHVSIDANDFYNSMNYCTGNSGTIGCYNWFGTSSDRLSTIQNNLNNNFDSDYSLVTISNNSELVDDSGQPVYDVITMGYNWNPNNAA